jgi:hypothetical protein
MLGITKSNLRKTVEKILLMLYDTTAYLTTGQIQSTPVATVDASQTETGAQASTLTRGAFKMADPTLTPGLADKLLDPNNLVAVVTVGLMYMLWKFTNKRFDLERQEQDEIIKRIDELDRELLKLEAKLEAMKDE